MIMKNFKMLTWSISTSLLVMLTGAASAFADAPPPEQFEERIPIRQEQAQRFEEQGPEWKFRLSPGVTVWTFDEEDATVGPSLYADVWRTDIPVNFRVGVEGRHLNLEQAAAADIAEFPGKESEITYIRIPFAVEYYHDLTDDLRLYAGLGPDIVHTANDLSETTVGFHLGTRLHYAFNQHWGVAVEGGYLWTEVDGRSQDIDLDTAYITPQLSYTF